MAGSARRRTSKQTAASQRFINMRRTAASIALGLLSIAGTAQSQERNFIQCQREGGTLASASIYRISDAAWDTWDARSWSWKNGWCSSNDLTTEICDVRVERSSYTLEVRQSGRLSTLFVSSYTVLTIDRSTGAMRLRDEDRFRNSESLPWGAPEVDVTRGTCRRVDDPSIGAPPPPNL